MKTLQEKTVEFSHRAALVEAATAVLNEYTPFKSHHKVSFHTDDTQPTPWIIGQLERTDGTPIADSTDPLDREAGASQGRQRPHPPLLPAHVRHPLGGDRRQRVHRCGL